MRPAPSGPAEPAGAPPEADGAAGDGVASGAASGVATPKSALDTSADLQFAAFTVAVAVVLLVGASVLPPPLFDPLGSAAVPQALAVILLALSASVVWSAWKARRARMGARTTSDWGGLLRGAAIVGLTALYAALLEARFVPFWLATALFVPLGAFILAGREPRVLGVSLVLALVLGVGGQFVFTRFFYIDLPT